jgi:hypothetical protein
MPALYHIIVKVLCLYLYTLHILRPRLVGHCDSACAVILKYGARTRCTYTNYVIIISSSDWLLCLVWEYKLKIWVLLGIVFTQLS